MPETYTEARPGFQGSETSYFEVTVYRHGDDPVVLTPAEELPIKGRRPQDVQPSLISASTSKALGPAAGVFSFQMKPSKATGALFDQLMDDDWVDLVIYRHGQPWHVMRGLTDEIRRSRTVGGTGATSEIYTVTGRDFGKIWEITPVWFSPYANDIVSQAIANKVFQARPEVLGDPGTAVQAYLKKFLEELAGQKGPNWEPPPGMPNVEAGSFLNSVVFKVAAPYFQNKPARQAFNPGFMVPQGTLWSLAQQFSDPTFTELYVDLLPDGDPFSGRISAGDALTPNDTQMAVVLRDKPFPVVDAALTQRLGYTPQWDKVPVLNIPRQQIVTSDLGRGGLERFNAYFVAAVVHQELMNANALNLIAPLMDRKSLTRHGLRRMDVQLSQVPDASNLNFVEMAENHRRLLKDWYVLNPYMLSGSINLGIGRPDAKVGCRARIPTSEIGQEETYYIEQVGHTWSFGTSVKTSLGVTRGWRGDDDNYAENLKKESDKYVVPLILPDEDLGIGTA